MLDFLIFRVRIVVQMEEILHFLHTGCCQIDYLILFINNKISGFLLLNTHDGIQFAQILHILAALHSAGKKIAHFMALECEEKRYRHIHATGSFGWRWMPEYVKEHGVDLEKNPHLTMQEYIYNMPTLMAAADLFISRAGASTLNEIAAAGTPCIIVPSPNVTNNHQEKNARVLEQRGAAVVIREDHCDGQKLYAAAKELLEDENRCKAMRKALHDMAVIDSTERIYQIICDLAKSHKS